MVSRLIYAKIWEDTFFTSLSCAEKVLFMYFLTNHAVNIINLYERPERLILFDTNVAAKDLENTKNKLEANKKMFFYKDYIYIANAHRYQEYSGEANEKAKRRLYEQLPKDVLDWFYSIPNTLQIPPRQSLKSKSYKRPKYGDDLNLDEIAEGIEKQKTAAKN